MIWGKGKSRTMFGCGGLMDCLRLVMSGKRIVIKKKTCRAVSNQSKPSEPLFKEWVMKKDDDKIAWYII